FALRPFDGKVCPQAVIQHSTEECWVGGLPTFLCPGVLDPARRPRERPAVRRQRAEYLGVVMRRATVLRAFQRLSERYGLPNEWRRSGCLILAARRCQGDLNTPVLRAPLGCRVWRNRIAVAMPFCRDKFGLHALRNQKLHHGIGALLRELQVR